MTFQKTINTRNTEANVYRMFDDKKIGWVISTTLVTGLIFRVFGFMASRLYTEDICEIISSKAPLLFSESCSKIDSRHYCCYSSTYKMGSNILITMAALVTTVAIWPASCIPPTCQKNGVQLQCANIDRSSISYLETSATQALDCYSIKIDNSVVNEAPSDSFALNQFNQFYGSNLTFTTFPFDLLWSLIPQTHTLSIQYSFFTIFDTERLAELPYANSLTSLTINHNYLNSLPSAAFAGFPELRDLDLTFNQLRTLADGTFDGLEKLETLQLAYNGLYDIGVGSFVGLDSVVSLVLTGNRLFNLPQGSFGNTILPNMTDLQLFDNPFVCNCELQWFQIWLVETGLEDSSGAACVCPAVGPFKNVNFCTPETSTC